MEPKWEVVEDCFVLNVHDNTNITYSNGCWIVLDDDHRLFDKDYLTPEEAIEAVNKSYDIDAPYDIDSGRSEIREYLINEIRNKLYYLSHVNSSLLHDLELFREVTNNNSQDTVEGDIMLSTFERSYDNFDRYYHYWRDKYVSKEAGEEVLQCD